MENKPTYQKSSIFQPNKTIAIFGYLIGLFVSSLFLQYIVAFIASNAMNVDYDTLLKSITDSEIVLSGKLIEANALAQGLLNLFAYLISAIFVVFYMRDDIALDFKDLLNRKKYHALYIPIAGILFMIFAFLLDLLFAQLVTDSENQETIVNIMTSGGAVPMIIATIILAPIVEELIYRKVIFHYFKKKGIWLCYLLSIVLFTLPHMLTTTSNVGIWVIQSLPYAISAFMLCFIYHKSNYNIYSSIAAHAFNNILAVILVYMTM